MTAAQVARLQLIDAQIESFRGTVLVPSRRALLRGTRTRAFAETGVLMMYQCLNTSDAPAEPEAVHAVRTLARQRPRYPVTLAADGSTIAMLRRANHLALWDGVMALDTEAANNSMAVHWPPSVPRREQDGATVLEGIAATRANDNRKLRLYYLWKLLALLSSPYERTLFIDNDILLFSPTFVADLLEGSLHVADLVFGQDPNRPPKRHGRANTENRMAWARKYGHAIVTPEMYAHGLPPMCTCVMAYRRTPSVERLFESAAARLMLSTNPVDDSHNKSWIARSARQATAAERRRPPPAGIALDLVQGQRWP